MERVICGSLNENKHMKSATFRRFLFSFTLTNDTFSKRGTFKGGESQIPNLDRASGARDEDVVTLQVSVDDGRRSRVQEVKPFQDLSTPTLEQLELHLLESLQVAVNKQRGARLNRAFPKQIKTLNEEKVP